VGLFRRRRRIHRTLRRWVPSLPPSAPEESVQVITESDGSMLVIEDGAMVLTA